MRIASMVMLIVLCLALIVVPIFEAIAFSKGLDFALYNEKAIVWTQTGLCLAVAITLFVFWFVTKKEFEFGITEKIFGMLLLPISILNAMCFIKSEWQFSIFVGIIWVGICIVIYGKFVEDSIFKALSAIVSVLLGIALVGLYIYYGVLQPVIGERILDSSYTSPSGQYVAELATEKSPMSEKTVVYVKSVYPQEFGFLGEYRYKSVDFYNGEAHEIHTVKVEWKNDNTFTVNGNEYTVKFEPEAIPQQ